MDISIDISMDIHIHGKPGFSRHKIYDDSCRNVDKKCQEIYTND